jgi:hypothetical protein
MTHAHATHLIYAFALEEMRLRAVRDDALIRTLLGLWVSELEPVICRDQDLRIIGLGAGWGVIVPVPER